MAGRYDGELVAQLDRAAALRAEEQRLWSEIKASEEALLLLNQRWEDVCSAQREMEEGNV